MVHSWYLSHGPFFCQKTNMDKIDKKILDILKVKARTSSSEIGKEVQLSIPAVTERMKKLEQAGVIQAYTVKVDRIKLGYGLLAFIQVNIDHSNGQSMFIEKVNSLKEIMECHYIAGEYDYIIKVACRDAVELQNFINSHLKGVQGIVKTQTTVVLSSVKENLNV